MHQPPSQDSKAGLWAAIAAYGVWGILPMYWKQIEAVPALEIMLHRIVWSFLLLFLLILFTKRLKPCLKLLKNRRIFFTLLGSGGIIAGNWFGYIWAVNNGQILATSLGYFLAPIFNMMCGVIVFKDSLSRAQWLAVGLAFAGVAGQVVIAGDLPVIALLLSLSFTIYGVIRKTAPIGALNGLFIETLLLLPLALGFLLWLGWRQELYFGGNNLADFFLAASGLITAVPMLWFAYGARHLRLTTLGLVQYLSPSLTFLTAIFVYHESMNSASLLSFFLIWSALAVYTLASIRQHRRMQKILRTTPR